MSKLVTTIRALEVNEPIQWQTMKSLGLTKVDDTEVSYEYLLNITSLDNVIHLINKLTKGQSFTFEFGKRRRKIEEAFAHKLAKLTYQAGEQYYHEHQKDEQGFKATRRAIEKSDRRIADAIERAEVVKQKEAKRIEEYQDNLIHKAELAYYEAIQHAQIVKESEAKRVSEVQDKVILRVMEEEKTFRMNLECKYALANEVNESLEEKIKRLKRKESDAIKIKLIQMLSRVNKYV